MKSLLFVLLFIMSSLVIGQDLYRHPRVVEVEEKLTKDAYQFLEKRFPKIPFIVNIEIDPLRRASGAQYGETGESLPYFEVDR